MKKRIVLSTLAALICMAAILPANAQTKPQMAEDVFKNVQILKGIPADEFMNTMGFFAASLSFNCTSCHGLESAGDVARFADDTPLKQTARRMILIVRSINQANFAGMRKVTCYTCHRGGEKPEVTPSLAQQYSTPLPDDPNQFEATGGERFTADEVFDKYIQALGGAQQLAKLASFSARGTYGGYDTDREEVPVEVFAKAPDQRVTIVHLPDGNKIMSYDGRDGWIAEPDTPPAVDPIERGRSGWSQNRRDAALCCGGERKPQSMGGGHDYDRRPPGASRRGIRKRPNSPEVVFRQGLGVIGKSGALCQHGRWPGSHSSRLQRLSPLIRSHAAVQVDGDLGGRAIDHQLSEVQPNVAIDAAQFAKPAMPAAPTAPAKQ